MKMEQQQRVPLGIWLIISFFVLSITIWIVGQAGALFAYDAVAAFGLQETRESVDPVVVEVNRGIAFADVVIQVPLFVLAIIGLWRLRFFGAVAAWLAMGVHMYWPTAAWAKQYFYLKAGVKCEPFAVSFHGILAFFFFCSVWASWYLYKNRQLLR
jgi:hypothetical protein